MRFFRILFFTLVCVSFVVGCSSERRKDATEDATFYTSDDNGTVETETLSMLLSINTLMELQNLGVLDTFAKRMLGFGYDVDFDITERYMNDNDVFLWLHAQLMAGNPPDLFVVYDIPLFAYANRGYVADIWSLIDNDPHYSRDLVYTNVLEAFEINGKLVAWPMAF